MKKIKIISVVGARPNFMKIAPFVREIAGQKKRSQARIEHVLVHTGQHYDVNMSQSFFQALDIPDPDINLEVDRGAMPSRWGRP
jgi:UDP-N-acetylglucosamine 2-epimerase (non-hydrolysing)